MSSELKTNKISPATGTTTTLGDASDVFQLPASAEIDIASGATLDVNGTLDVTGATVTGLSAGKVLQVKYTAYAGQTSNHSSSSWSTTGSMSVSITPSSASNMILVMSNDSFYLAGSGSSATHSNAAIFETGSGTMVAFQYLGHNGSEADVCNASMVGIYDPSDTSALTFQTKSYNDGAYYTWPRVQGGQIDTSASPYYIIALEYEV